VPEDLYLFSWDPLKERTPVPPYPVAIFALFVPYDGKGYSFRNACLKTEEGGQCKTKNNEL